MFEGKKLARLWIVAGVLVVAIGVVAVLVYSRQTALPAPVKPVEKLLELRRDRSKDTTAFAGLVKSSAVATALVSDVTTANAHTSPIPSWETPYLTSQSTSTAEVAVVWKKDARFKTWARATVFSVERIKGHWVVGDANVETGTVPPRIKAAK